MPRSGFRASLTRLCLYCGLIATTAYLCAMWSSMGSVSAQQPPTRPRIVPSFKNGSSIATRPIIMLKLPRTGSTWLTDILNSFKEIYLTKEIVQGADVGRFSDAEMQRHLLRALRFPADRISNSKSYLPSIHYFEEFVKTYKFTVRMRMLGFTVNPEHIGENVLKSILSKVPRAEMIILKRRNLVKLAISAATGRNVKARTGMNNLRAGELLVHESDYRLPWNLTTFLSEYYRTKARYTSFLEKVNMLNISVHTIYYEDLQIDLEKALDELFTSFGYENLLWPGHLEHAAAALFNASDAGTATVSDLHRKDVSKLEKQKTKWKKRTPESLRTVLTNYNYLHETILRKSRKHGLSDHYVGHPVPASDLRCILEQLESEVPALQFVNCPELS